MDQTEYQKRRAERFRKGEEILGKVEISRHEFPGCVVFKLALPPGETTKFYTSRENFLVLMNKLKSKNSARCICGGGGYVRGGTVILTRKEDNIIVKIKVKGYDVILELVEEHPGQILKGRGYHVSGHALPFFEVKYQELQEIKKNLKEKGGDCNEK